MSYRKLGRNSGARKALFKSLLAVFFTYGRIETTEAKAKELRKFADKVVTLAKRGDLSARRQAIQMVGNDDVVHKIFEELPQKFNSREGGYTRILKLGPRRGDAAPMVLILLQICLHAFAMLILSIMIRLKFPARRSKPQLRKFLSRKVSFVTTPSRRTTSKAF